MNDKSRIYGTLTEQGFFRYGYMGIKKGDFVIAHKRKNETWFMVDDHDNFIDTISEEKINTYINEKKRTSI